MGAPIREISESVTQAKHVANRSRRVALTGLRFEADVLLLAALDALAGDGVPTLRGRLARP
jgi:hypothetical protein